MQQNQDQTQNEPAPIQLYTGPTPNGYKVTVVLEELNIKYDVKIIDTTKNVQKEDWFLKINPNGRIPAIVDLSNNNFNVFESGSILLYLVDKYDKDHKISFPHGSDLYWQTVSWVFFQMAGVGPMLGQAAFFQRFAPEKIDYAINRYLNESRRLLSVIDSRLKENGDWLVGDKYSIADIINYTWVSFASMIGVDIKEFPALEKWCERIAAREAVKRGMSTPPRPAPKESAETK